MKIRSTRDGMNSSFGGDFVANSLIFQQNKYYHCTHVSMQNIDC